MTNLSRMTVAELREKLVRDYVLPTNPALDELCRRAEPVAHPRIMATTEVTCVKCGCTNKATIYEGREVLSAASSVDLCMVKVFNRDGDHDRCSQSLPCPTHGMRLTTRKP